VPQVKLFLGGEKVFLPERFKNSESPWSVSGFHGNAAPPPTPWYEPISEVIAIPLRPELPWLATRFTKISLCLNALETGAG